MSTNNSSQSSWAQVAANPQGLKRSKKDQLDNFNALGKRGPFQVTTNYLSYLEKHSLYKNLAHAYPKSSIKHGVRIRFCTKFPATLVAILENIKKVYPKMVSIDPKYLKGTIDVGFKTKDDADEASTNDFIVKLGGIDQHIATTRTRYHADEHTFIAFEGLPMDVEREEIQLALEEGLASYGEIIQLEYQECHLVKGMAMPKAIALIKSKPEVTKNISLIPRYAFFKIGNEATSTFKVFPEAAPPICQKCERVGHRATACPTTVEGLLRCEEDFSMDDDIENIATSAFMWGAHTTIKVIDPVTQKERKLAAEALKKAALKKEADEKREQQKKKETDSNKMDDEVSNTSHEFPGTDSQTPLTPNVADSNQNGGQSGVSEKFINPNFAKEKLTNDGSTDPNWEENGRQTRPEFTQEPGVKKPRHSSKSVTRSRTGNLA